MPEKISNMVDAIQQGGPGCADSETEAARGVEASVSVLQSQFPPPQLKKSTRKRMAEQISNMVDALQQGGHGCADSETEAARGVEEAVSVLQSQSLPPQLKKSTRKQDEAEVACSGDRFGCADVETDEVHGVEEFFSTLQSLVPPPGWNKLRHSKIASQDKTCRSQRGSAVASQRGKAQMYPHTTKSSASSTPQDQGGV